MSLYDNEWVTVYQYFKQNGWTEIEIVVTLQRILRVCIFKDHIYVVHNRPLFGQVVSVPWYQFDVLSTDSIPKRDKLIRQNTGSYFEEFQL